MPKMDVLTFLEVNKKYIKQSKYHIKLKQIRYKFPFSLIIFQNPKCK